jgi:hypothetical protein
VECRTYDDRKDVDPDTSGIGYDETYCSPAVVGGSNPGPLAIACGLYRPDDVDGWGDNS